MVKNRARVLVIAIVAVLLSSCIRFEEPVTFSAGLQPSETATRVVVADVTGDGNDALVVTSTGTVRYEHCGAGCFQRREHLPGVTIRQVADFDGDGIDDVHTGPQILFGGPEAGERPEGLTLSDAVAVPAFASSPAGVGDFNGDGNVDVLNGTPVAPSYVMWDAAYGDGAGGFSRGLNHSGSLAGRVPAIGDVNGDGRDDVATRFINGDLEIVVNGGTPVGVGFRVPGDSSTFALGDIDGDGRDDLALEEGDQIRLLRSTGTSMVPFPDPQTYPSSIFPDLALRDIDGDGIVDLLMESTSTGPRWRSGTGDGQFRYGAPTPPPGALTSATTGNIGDIDGDGLPDVFVPNGEPSAGVSLYLNSSFT